MPEHIMLTLDQQRAKYAWERAEKNRPHGKTYVNFTKSAPAFIMVNGLMQALAFYESRKKNDKAAHEIVTDVVNWLGLRMDPPLQDASFGSMMEKLYGMPSEQYMQATRETLAMLRWLRQFADALKKDEPITSTGDKK